MRFISRLKIGDKVAYGTKTCDSKYISEVVRITPSGLIYLKHGIKFNAKGVETGKPHRFFNKRYLYEITPEILASVQKRELLSEIKEFEFDDLSLDKLRKIHRILFEEC